MKNKTIAAIDALPLNSRMYDYVAACSFVSHYWRPMDEQQVSSTIKFLVRCKNSIEANERYVLLETTQWKELMQLN